MFKVVTISYVVYRDSGWRAIKRGWSIIVVNFRLAKMPATICIFDRRGEISKKAILALDLLF